MKNVRSHGDSWRTFRNAECGWRPVPETTTVVGMGSRGSAVTFGLFVVVLLGAVWWLLRQPGSTNWALVVVLLGILVLRAVLFLVNLRQQRRNIERGTGPVRIETRLGLNDEPEDDSPSPSQVQSQASSSQTRSRPDQ
jgi:hypothetical protein